jgi:hypothetical protein
MGLLMSTFKFTITDIIDQTDGSALVIFDIDKKARQEIKQLYGWKRWNTKKFQQLFTTAIDSYVTIKKQEKENAS